MFFFFSSRRRHTRFDCDWSSDVCSSDLEDLIFIKESAQSDNDILTNDAWRKSSFEHYLGDLRNLPPSHSGSPNTGGVGPHDRRPECCHRAVKIRMRIAGHHHGARNNIALLHHHLVRDTGARRIKIDAVLASELLDGGVFLQVFWRDVLNIMIDGEHWLRRICDRRRSNLLELRDHRAGVVVRHHMARPNGDEIAAAHTFTNSESIRMPRRNFLNKRQAHINCPIKYPVAVCASSVAVAGIADASRPGSPIPATAFSPCASQAPWRCRNQRNRRDEK